MQIGKAFKSLPTELYSHYCIDWCIGTWNAWFIAPKPAFGGTEK